MASEEDKNNVVAHPAFAPDDKLYAINGMVFNELEYLRNTLGAFELAWSLVRRQLIWKTEFVWQGRKMQGTVIARDKEAAEGCCKNRSLNETVLDLYDMKGASL